MSRAERLLHLLQILRVHRCPVSGAALSEKLGISLRSLYRDIASLQAQGADIEGEAGVGYRLRTGYHLPPLMFSRDEIEALVLGSNWVLEEGDTGLQEAARNALAKIAAVVPPAMKEAMHSTGLLVGPDDEAFDRGDVLLEKIRRAMRDGHVVKIRYYDREGDTSRRLVWPFALGYFKKARVMAAWCTLRKDFRHFRVDRIEAFTVLQERFPEPRRTLLHRWRKQEGIELEQIET